MLYGLASNPNAPIKILSDLVDERYTPIWDQLWDQLARNPSTPSHLLEAILTDHKHLASQIAENPATEAHLLKKIATDWGRSEHVVLARNPNFILEWLQPPPKSVKDTRHLVGISVEEMAFGGGPVSLDKNRWKLPSGRAKVRILFLRSDPGDASRLDLSGESGQIKITLERTQPQQLHLEPLDMTTVEEVGRALIRIKQPTILHFAGHGSPDGKMYWRKSIKENSAYPIPVEVFAKMIAAIKDHKIVCVFLNACYLASEAKHLLQHVPYVIASRTAIADTAAIDFSSGFYTWLGEGKDIGESFNYALSLVEANLPGLQEHLKPVLLEREANSSREGQF